MLSWWQLRDAFFGKFCNMLSVDCSVGIDGFHLKEGFGFLPFIGDKIEASVIELLACRELHGGQ